MIQKKYTNEEVIKVLEDLVANVSKLSEEELLDILQQAREINSLIDELDKEYVPNGYESDGDDELI